MINTSVNFSWRTMGSVPPSMETRGQDYLRAIRESSLSTIFFLVLIGILAYLFMLALDCFAGSCRDRVAPRGLVIFALVALGLATRLPRQLVLDKFTAIIGSMAALVMTTVTMTAPDLRVNSESVTGFLGSIIAILALYVFIRLSARVLFGIGVSSAALSFAAGSRLCCSTDAELPTLVYLCLVNVLGYAIARSIDTRECELFLQRRLAASHAAELEARTSAAERAIEEKNRVLAAVAHDLRQPLRAAALHSGALIDRLADGDMVEGSRQAQHVAKGLEMLSLSVDQLLLASREDFGRAHRLGSVPLAPLVERVGWIFEDDCEERGLALRIVIGNPDLVLRTDEEALFRVLVNLVGNAVKFTRPAETDEDRPISVRGVTIRAVDRGDHCRISVTDNGIGMTSSECRHAWDAFYQAGGGAGRDRRGMGLGLYFVQQTMASLPGHAVTLRSRYGRGTRLVLTVPVVAQTAAVRSA